MPTANPDATVMFPAGVPTGGEAGKSKLLSMILRSINAAMERAHYEIIEHAEPFYGSIPGIQGVWADRGHPWRPAERSWPALAAVLLAISLVLPLVVVFLESSVRR